MVTRDDKLNLLNDRLKCLAKLEYEGLRGLNKQIAKNLDSYTEKYIDRFIKLVTTKETVLSVIDSQVKNNIL